jgi:hypothetical protein
MRFFVQNNSDLVDSIPVAPDVYGNIFGLDFSLFDLLNIDSPFGGWLDTLATIWNIYTILAYIISFILLIIYIYATIRWNEYLAVQAQLIRDEEALYDEYYRGAKPNNRLDEVLQHIASEEPADWKLAIIEADILLDGLLKERGYAGNSLGERLRSITPAQLSSIDDAWEAHKVRNQIAHEGADFILTKRLADQTISRYQRVFNEFGIS